MLSRRETSPMDENDTHGCRYCEDSFTDEDDHVNHLTTAHDISELDRIDRRRVKIAETAGARTRSRYTRRGILGALAVTGIAGTGLAAGGLSDATLPSVSSATDEKEGNRESEHDSDTSTETTGPTVDSSEDALTFTTAGATGRTGPSQSAVDSEYTGTDLEGEVSVTGNGIQQWEVPSDGTYRITAYGAGGGGSDSGLGAKVSGAVDLTSGETLSIVVGQTGTAPEGGGGGSFVALGSDPSTADPLVVAGGGSGEGIDGPQGFMHATVPTAGETESDGQDNSCGTGEGGSDGEGGTTTRNNFVAGAGGGFKTNGENGYYIEDEVSSSGGQAFRNGAVGGEPTDGDAPGGFGGGGGGYEGDESGGGGGYNGGAGGDFSSCGADDSMGGGGGSYNIGSEPDNQTEANNGDGLVEIEGPPPPSVQIDGEDVTLSNTTVKNDE